MKRISNLFLGAAASAALVFAPATHGWAQSAASLSSLLGQLGTASKASGDSTLNSLGGDLSSKVQSLDKSLTGNTAAQSQLTGAVQSLLSGNGASSLGAFSKLSEAKLTPEQTKLAKDVGNVGGAYLVQKNFASLEGSQSDVAQIVNSLRKGSPTAAIPSIQNVANNAKLTPAQKELASSLADKYAPGAKKIGGALDGGLKSIPGLGK